MDLLVLGGPAHGFVMSKPATRADAATKPHDWPLISVEIRLREWIDA